MTYFMYSGPDGAIAESRRRYGYPKKEEPATTSTTTPVIERTSIDTTAVPSSAIKDAPPATQTFANPATASNTQSAVPAMQGLQEANSTTAGSVILGGGASTGGGYQGVADAPLGAAGQDNQFLRRAGSILLR